MITKKRWLKACEDTWDLFHDNPEMQGSIQFTLRRYSHTHSGLWIYNGESGDSVNTFSPVCPKALRILCGGSNSGKVLKVKGQVINKC